MPKSMKRKEPLRRPGRRPARPRAARRGQVQLPGLLSLLARATSHFIACTADSVDDAIKRTLVDIGELFRVDRVYVFKMSPGEDFACNTHEWCAPGIPPQIDNLQQVPFEAVPWFMEELSAHRHIALASLNELPRAAASERFLLESQGIRSILIVPMLWGDRPEGFAGFDDVHGHRRWSDTEVAVLRIIVNAIAQAFERMRREAATRSLTRMAYHDPLTELPNRTLLAERLDEQMARTPEERPLLGICYLDLDGFKGVNDQFGHAAGDRLLIEIARRMTASVRRDDTVARVGGDEFVVLMPEVRDRAEAIARVERLRQAITEPVDLLPGEQVSVGVSAGLRLVSPDEAGSDRLLREADQAMYAAKLWDDAGFQVFDPERHT